MEWVRVQIGSEVCFGVRSEAGIQRCSNRWDEIVAGRPPLSRVDLADGEFRLLSSIPPPGKIVAIGQNYMDHCREQKVDPPRSPMVFAKFPSSVVGPGDTICWRGELTQKVDFEAELAVVMGRRARRISSKGALDYVLGYTAGNDVSARDLQFGDKQWVRGKSLDTFCPLGPALVTGDQISDPQQLSICGWLNDRCQQKSNTREMIFSVAELISFCSQAFTLEPGDVILTGTPDGVGVFRDPPVFLSDGDEVTVEIEKIGRLSNPCRVSSD